MALRWRHGYGENGDITDLQWWLLDNNELAGEVNGGLDRDNFGAADIAQNEIVVDAFTRVDSWNSITNFLVENDTMTWQGGDGNGATGIFEREVTCAVDCVLDVRCALSWIWTGAASSTGYTDSDAIRFKVTVDGYEVALTGWFSDFHEEYAATMQGCFLAVSGVHTIRVEAMAGKLSSATLDVLGANTNDCNVRDRNLIAIQEKR